MVNNQIIKQLIRSSGSVGANYIEANESLGKKDFLMHIRICRKEAKETIYWLKVIELDKTELETQRSSLIDEATQFTKMFSSILVKSQ